MIVYIIELRGYKKESGSLWISKFGTFIETTTNPVFAKVWARETTAQSNADKALHKLQHEGWTEIKVVVRKAEFNLLPE